MKKLKQQLLLATVLLTFSLQAQELGRYVFATGGGTETSSNLKLSWTIGQSGLVGTFTQNSLTLNVGFQQKDTLDIGSKIPEAKNPVFLRVFPNPFYDAFHINLEFEHRGELSYYLYDNTGKQIINKQCIPYNGYFFNERVEFSELSPGIYNLTLFFYPGKNSPERYSIKLIKQ